jgi:hypothetical protein
VNVCRYNRCHDNAVEGFWTLWDNIVTVFAALDFPVSLDELFTSLYYINYCVACYRHSKGNFKINPRHYLQQ